MCNENKDCCKAYYDKKMGKVMENVVGVVFILLILLGLYGSMFL